MIRTLSVLAFAAALVGSLLAGDARAQDGQPAQPPVQSPTTAPCDADALWAAGRRADALDLMAQDLAAHPQDDALRLRLAQRQLAVQHCAAALATAAPLGAQADAVRGPALYVLARYEEALPLLTGDDPQVVLMRVDALLALARAEEADAALARARAVLGENHPRLLALTGRRLADKGQHAQAVEAFRAALERDPLDRQALFGLGQSLVRSGHKEEGLAIMERHRALLPLLDTHDSAVQALDMDQSHAPSHAAVGDSERALGLLDSAQQRYRRAEDLAEPGELTPIVLRHARLLVEDLHDLPAALALLDLAGSRVPDARLPVRAGDLLLDAGRFEEAAQRFRRALELRPEDGPVQQRLKAAEERRAGGQPAAPASDGTPR